MRIPFSSHRGGVFHDQFWEASFRSRMAVCLPSCMTTIRSLMPRISGSSEETRRMEFPSAASSEMIAWISALAPRQCRGGFVEDEDVRSSEEPPGHEDFLLIASAQVLNAGLVARSAGAETFVVLPGVGADAGEIEQSQRFFYVGNQIGDDGVVRNAPTPMIPVLRRSSVRKASPARLASRGLRMRVSLPSMRTRPDEMGRRPKRVSMSSVRPAPTSPAKPRISPLRRSKVTFSKAPGEERSSTRRRTSPRGTSCLGKRLVSSRPTIMRMSSRW